MFVIGAGNLVANAHSVAHVTSFFAVAVFALVLMFILMKVATTGYHRGAIMSIPIALIVGVVMMDPGIIKQFLGPFFGGDDSMTLRAVHPANRQVTHHVPHHATWLAKHWLGVVAAFVSFVALIAAVWLFARAAKRWYNRPAKLEARERKRNEVLQRVDQGLDDNPDLKRLETLLVQLDKVSLHSDAGRAKAARIRAKLEQRIQVEQASEEVTALEWFNNELGDSDSK
jgi:hypothetical protein